MIERKMIRTASTMRDCTVITGGRSERDNIYISGSRFPAKAPGDIAICIQHRNEPMEFRHLSRARAAELVAALIDRLKEEEGKS